MYRATADPYCYPDSSVLRNLPGIQTRIALARFEAAITAQRASEPLPSGRLGVRHYKAVHRHLFQDVYAWAGHYRTVRIAKGGSAFCYPEYIDREMRSLFDRLRKDRSLRNLDAERFSKKAAAFLATLNAIHPFRDGNGRTQLTFIALLAGRAGHPLALDRLVARRFLAAMVQSFHGRHEPLEAEMLRLVR